MEKTKPAFIELYDIRQNKVVAIRDTNKEPGELLSCNLGSVEITSDNYQNYRIIKVYQK